MVLARIYDWYFNAKSLSDLVNDLQKSTIHSTSNRLIWTHLIDTVVTLKFDILIIGFFGTEM